MSGSVSSHQYFGKRVSVAVGHVSNHVTMSSTTARTIAVYTEDAIGRHPARRIPTYIVYRSFLDTGVAAGFGSIADKRLAALELAQAAEEALIRRSSTLCDEADMDWLHDETRPYPPVPENLFDTVDRAPTLPSAHGFMYSPKPALQVCLSAPPNGALIYCPSDDKLPTIFLHPGDAILSHRNGKMDHYADPGQECVFLRFHSGIDHPSLGDMIVLPPNPIPIETEEEKEDRELEAEVTAEVELAFELEEKAREGRLEKVRAEKEAVKKEHEASVQRTKRVEKKNQLVKDLFARRQAEWDEGSKHLDAEEKELEENREKYRLQAELEQGVTKEQGRGPVKGPTPVERIQVRLWQKTVEIKVEDQGDSEEDDHEGEQEGMEKDIGDEGILNAIVSSGPEVIAALKPTDASIQTAATSQPLPTKPTSTRKRKAASSSADLPIEEEGKVTRRGRAY